MKSFSRRDILRFGAAGLGSLLVPAGMRTIVSAAEVTTGPEKAPGPAIKNHKINPPASGCYVGFWTGWEQTIFYEYLRPARPAFDRARSLEERVQLQASIQAKFDPVSIARIKKDVEGYEKDMGVKPYFSVNRDLAKIWSPFPTFLSIGMKQLGLVPVLYAALESGDQHYTPQMKDGSFSNRVGKVD